MSDAVEELAKEIRAWSAIRSPFLGSHWDGCWHDHPGCMAAILIRDANTREAQARADERKRCAGLANNVRDESAHCNEGALEINVEACASYSAAIRKEAKKHE